MLTAMLKITVVNHSLVLTKKLALYYHYTGDLLATAMPKFKQTSELFLVSTQR